MGTPAELGLWRTPAIRKPAKTINCWPPPVKTKPLSSGTRKLANCWRACHLIIKEMFLQWSFRQMGIGWPQRETILGGLPYGMYALSSATENGQERASN